MTHGKPRYKVGQLVSWPTLSHTTLPVDFVDWQAVAAKVASSSHQFDIPRYHAVVFELLRNGGALAAYNGRFTQAELLENPVLPVLWLQP